MSIKKITYFLTLSSIITLLGAGCSAQQANIAPPEKNTPAEIAKTYTVDEFVENGFKKDEKVRIQIKSVTCYNNSCGLEGGGKWGVSMNIANSKVFYPYAGKAVDMVVEAEPDCPIEAQQCNIIKNVVIVKPDQNNQNELSTISNDTNAEFNNIFLSSIPKRDFAHLTLKDFPSIQKNYGIPKAVTWNGKVFIPSNTTVIEYDFSGKILGYSDWRKIDCANDIQVINNSLYIACRDKGIYEIDLSTNKMAYLYNQKDGIKELRNLQLTADRENLWIGSYNGVAKIETKTRKVQFYQNELGGGNDKEGPAFGSVVYARNGEVWATVSASGYNDGAVSQYNYATNQWTIYSVKDLKQKDVSRLDIDNFIISDKGIYASFQDGGPQNVVLKKFDPTTKKWTETYHAEYQEFNKNLAQHLPALETYASSEMQFDQNENLPIIKYSISRNGKAYRLWV